MGGGVSPGEAPAAPTVDKAELLRMIGEIRQQLNAMEVALQ